MGSAFRLLWSIRRAARAVYPTQAQQPWWREYLVQLFLFAHLALKWPDPSSVTLHATAAMVGVAAEVLDEQGIYRFWSSEELGATAVEILGSLEHDPANALAELAQLVGELDRRRLPRDDRDRLDEAVERVRAAFVREYFEDAALGTLHRLKLDHDVYISLLAYIGLTGHLHEPGSRDPKARRPHQEPPEGDGSPEGRDGAGLGPGDADLTLLLEEAEAARTEQGDSRDVLELLTELREVVILGDAGAGKSTVARELEYRLAEAVVTEEPGQLLPRMPVIVRASRIADQLDDPATGKPRPCADVLLGAIGGTWPTDLLTVGALHVTVDALNELGDPHKDRVAEWLTELRRRFPRTPVAACHRLYLYEPGLLPFRTVTLDKVAPEQAEGYIHDYLRENQVPDHEAMARRLVHLLLDPEHEQVRDLAQTPLFLWMIVSRYRETGVRPSNRGQLFHDFSRWYMEERHHSEQDELAAWEFGYEQKSELLEAVAAALVDRGSTEIAEEEVVPPLVPESLGPRWREVLEATVRSEMVRRSDGQLRFLHQSFQEYFAARHFLRTAANDPGVVRSRVHSHRWHDTSTILLGFAGERPDVVTRVLQTALEVNPTLTARCLRVAERPEPELLDRFVKEQEATLRNPRAGDHAQERAATALAEYGRGPARDVLVKLATDPSAHLASRAKAINRLAGMVGQARSETRQRDLRDDLTKALVRLFEEVAPSQDPASTEVLRAAIDAAARARLTALALVVADLVNDSMPWSLADAAYQALPALGIVPPAKLQARYRRLCQARLPEIERELLAASINDQFEKLQEERVAILGQLVDPANLERLLRRRFALGIANRVGPLLERAVELPGDVPAAARRAWEVLREPAAAGPPPLGRWLRLLADADDLTAVAAAHRIQATGEGGDGARLAALLRPDQSPTKLCALAGLLQQDGDVRLLERAEGLVQTLMTTIEGPEATEAVACLVQAIRALDTKRGHRLAAVVDYMFWTRVEATQPDRFPWLAVWTGTWLESKDIEVLLQGDANQVAAAVQFLYNTAGWGLLRANYPVPTRRLDPQAMERLTVAAHGEREPARQRIIACAAAGVDAFDLLPWLLELVEAPELSAWNHDVDSHYGDVEESCRAMVLRATGYLARRANQPHGSIAERAELTLRHFSEAEDRSTVVGAVTGLAYLGDWKAVLRTLGPGEPWLREVAQNVFRRWVPFADLKGATRWIACRLRDDPDLHPDVRSSLELIKDENERQLGHHVTCDE